MFSTLTKDHFPSQFGAAIKRSGDMSQQNTQYTDDDKTVDCHLISKASSNEERVPIHRRRKGRRHSTGSSDHYKSYYFYHNEKCVVDNSTITAGSRQDVINCNFHRLRLVDFLSYQDTKKS